MGTNLTKDATAFCEAMYPRVFGALGLYTGEAALAEELTQEVMLRLHELLRNAAFEAPDFDAGSLRTTRTTNAPKHTLRPFLIGLTLVTGTAVGIGFAVRADDSSKKPVQPSSATAKRIQTVPDSTPSHGDLSTNADGTIDVKDAPDFIVVRDSVGAKVGFAASSQFFGGPNTMDDPVPVYAIGFKTVVGHIYPYPYGYTPLGGSPVDRINPTP